MPRTLANLNTQADRMCSRALTLLQLLKSMACCEQLSMPAARQAAVQSGASILEAMTVPPAATDPELQRELASIHRYELIWRTSSVVICTFCRHVCSACQSGHHHHPAGCCWEKKRKEKNRKEKRLINNNNIKKDKKRKEKKRRCR